MTYLYVFTVIYCLACMYIQAYFEPTDNIFILTCMMLVAPVTFPILILLYIWLVVYNTVQMKKRGPL